MFFRLPVAALIAALPLAAASQDLDSWHDTGTKTQILEFVSRVSDPDSPDFVDEADRIAVFDNDGTLWAEKPVYFQLIFALSALQRMAHQDPSILTTDAMKAAVAEDWETVAKGGEKALMDILGATHGGVSVDQFMADVDAWLEAEQHPDTGLPYDEMTYQPMVDLLDHLRANGFKTYIVSGGGIHFMRVFAEDAYGIPPEQILGTYTETKYEIVDGTPTLMKEPSVAFVDDKTGKPINIDRVIGKRPILAVGNSDGDFQMLEWTTAGDGPRLGVLIHHTDGEREYAYDRDSHVGRLVDGLDKGPDMGWIIVDMAEDWKTIYTGAN